MGGLKLRVRTDDEYNRFFNLLIHPDIGTYLFKNINDIINNKDKLKNDNLICYLFNNGNDDMGVVGIHMMPTINKGVIDVGVLKEFRGKLIKQASIEVLKDLFSEKGKFDLFSFVKKDNKKSLYFSQCVGLKIFNKFNDNYILRFDHGWFDSKFI